MKNKLYEELRNYVKENSGFGSDLKKTELYKKLQKEREKLKQFENKKVKITYSYKADFIGGSGFKMGRIVFESEDKIKFYEGLNRTKFNYLDFGLYEGFYAVIILKEITEVSKEEFKEHLKKREADKFKRRFGF